MKKTAKVTIEFTRKQLEKSFRKYNSGVTDAAWEALSDNDIVIDLPYAESHSNLYPAPISGFSLALTSMDSIIEKMKDEEEDHPLIKIIKLSNEGKPVNIDVKLNGDETEEEALKKISEAILADIKNNRKK